MLKNNASNFHFHKMINDHSLQLQSQTHFPLQNLNVFQFRLQMMAAVIVMTIPRAVIMHSMHAQILIVYKLLSQYSSPPKYNLYM